MAIQNQKNNGAFVDITPIWDVDEIYSTDVTSPEFKELLVRLQQYINNIALLLNIKDSGYYNTQEFVNGQLLFPNPALSSATTTVPAFRQVFRTLVNFGHLPAGGTLSVNHNIDFSKTYTATRIYGAATDPVALSYIPLPYASNVANNNIELYVDATKVYISVAANWSTYTTCYVIIEYVKS